jgi:hypothetical protein
MKFGKFAIIATSVVLIVAGCGKSSSINSVTPSIDKLPIVQASPIESGRMILGFWNVEIDPESLTATVEPVRAAEMHLNITRFLELNCPGCLVINNIKWPDNEYITADIYVEHPLPPNAKQFIVYDVRGIVMTEADFQFPESGKRIAWYGDHLQLLNADGYTALYNPNDFPQSPDIPAFYTYYESKFGSDPAFLNATLNPYLAIRTSPGFVKPTAIRPGENAKRTVELNIPNGSIRFGFALDANWDLPIGNLDEWPKPGVFPPGAESREAYTLNARDFIYVDPETGSETPFEIILEDHQGIDTVEKVTVECPALFNGLVELTYKEKIQYYGHSYAGTIVNEKGTGEGEYPLLIKVTDKDPDEHLGQMAAWQVDTVRITDFHNPDEWARTWSSENGMDAQEVRVDSEQNIYVLGHFRGETDFDPDPMKWLYLNPKDFSGSFLLKLSPGGNFLWVRAWGGTGEYAREMELSASGDIYVTGRFDKPLNFVPDQSVDPIEAVSQDDVYVLIFNSDGQLQWVNSWDSGKDDDVVSLDILQDDGVRVVCDTQSGWFTLAYDNIGDLQQEKLLYMDTTINIGDIAITDSGDYYLTGWFTDTANFATDMGEVYADSNGELDIFLSRYNTSGDLIWVNTWGGSHSDRGTNLALDNSGNPVVVGRFEKSADMDPGSDFIKHTATTSSDIFMGNFDTDGNYLWSKTWGNGDYLADIDLFVGLDDMLVVTGSFKDEVDMDSGPLQDIFVSKGYRDVFVSVHNSDGIYQYALSIGGTLWDIGNCVSSDTSGNIYFAGQTYCTLLDVDPGPGIDERTLDEEPSAFLVKYKP